MASKVFSLFSLSFVSLAAAYSFDITAAPTQCGPLSLQITDGSGVPPYTALVVPFGAAQGQTEQRRVFMHNFTAQTTSFALPYPASSGFVVTVSDSTGVGTGGTSVPTSVGSSSNSSCLPNSVSTSFSFQLLPTTAINQCQQTTLAWDNKVQGDPTIYLIIPGGQSSQIPIVNPQSGLQGGVTGINWTPNIRAGTNIILVAGDSRGPGAGGSVNTAVGNSITSNSSCIDNDSPSSTAGTPAGAIQTGTPPDSGNGSHGGSDNVGAIVGGVVGGLAALIIMALLVLFYVRRRRINRHSGVQGVDLFPGRDAEMREQGDVPAPAEPEPYIVPAHSEYGTSERPSMSDVDRRYSALSTTDPSESVYTSATGTNLLSAGAGQGRASQGPASSRKTGLAPPQMRAVNFVQHEDAGELPEAGGSGQNDEPETIELPPSYTSVHR